MAATQTLLQLLRSRTVVDCDTMDLEVATSLGPFVDCTSNQAIAYYELQKPEHKGLIEESISYAKSLRRQTHGMYIIFADVEVKKLAVEVAMVKLQLAISKAVTGFVHVQTNPYFAYDVEKTATAGKRIMQIFGFLDPSFHTSRICLKIPATWEGFQACKDLHESLGALTLATTLFTMEQAVLAGEAGCRYIAPYVNELKVHFEEGFIDTNKAHALCLQAQQYYKSHNITTQVLPASLTSINEVMMLAGVDHITISPPLLEQLSEKKAGEWEGVSLFDVMDGREMRNEKREKEYGVSLWDEAGYRIAFTRSGGGEGERKLVQAINIFCDFQDKLEAMMG